MSGTWPRAEWARILHEAAPARDSEVPVWLAALSEQICNRARTQYGGGEAILEIVELLEDATRVALRA